VVVCFEIEENLEKKSNSLGLARCIIYVRYVNGSKIKICQLVKFIYREENFSDCVGKTDPKAGKKAQPDMYRNFLRPVTRTFNHFHS